MSDERMLRVEEAADFPVVLDDDGITVDWVWLKKKLEEDLRGKDTGDWDGSYDFVDLERAPRPEKEIREIYAGIMCDAKMSGGYTTVMTYLRKAFPYLSESKQEE